MSFDIHSLLRQQVAQHCPDLQLVTDEPPFLRQRNGKLLPIPEHASVTARQIEEVLEMLGGKAGLEKFRATKEFEISFTEPELSRFRVTFFETTRGPALTCREIPFVIPSPTELGIPREILTRVLQPDGLILVTGPNGSGKSTTLASLIEHINANREAHIITIEDPVEFVFNRKNSVISQREVGQNTNSFGTAIRHAMRQNVDVLVIGEMRDLETIATALTLAETGHLVLATLHTHDAPRAVQRIVDVFPADQQRQVALQLSHSLTAVMAQRLVPTADGRGRVCVREIMLANSGVRHAIRENKISELYSQIQINRESGMIGFDDALLELVRQGTINKKDALNAAHDPEQLAQNIGKA